MTRSKQGGWRLWFLPALALACAVTLACETPSGSGRPRPEVRVASAFAPLSDRLVEEYKRALPGVDVREVAAPDAIAALGAGTADLGISTADRAYAAYWKTTAGVRVDGPLRGIALLQPLSAYVLVRPGSRIQSVADFTGRVIGLGARASSSWTLGTLLIEAAGVTPKLIRIFNTRAEAAAALEDGSADAIFFPGYTYPDEAVYSTIRDGAYLIPIEGPAVRRLRRANPFVRATTIPRHVYEGQDRVIPTIGLDIVVICRDDLDEAVVHALTRALFDVFPRLSGVEASLRFLDVERAPAAPIPLHPGASRYFRERELSR
ncbi:MAG: TAXI family TRAP transporter solute-binding subunit [Actinobacteria bacterium]|nr:TAXI family TRAP transporter solute-binding subunit [Actinomycetota bacterium]